MKRTIVFLIVVLMTFIGLPCAAASGFYCEYTPKTERSSVFYIDLYSSEEIRAAVMELRFDDSIAEYREVSAVGNTSSVRAASDGGCVKIAFADSSAVSGKICRVAFKALQAGTCTFTLHVTQAADSEPKSLTGFSDYSLDVKLGKDDVVSDASAKASSKTSSASSVKSAASSRSSLSISSDTEDGDASVSGGFFDLRRKDDHGLTYVLIGAGSVVLIAALILMGILIGRRTVGKKKEVKKEGESAEEIDSKFLNEDDSENENPIE